LNGVKDTAKLMLSEVSALEGMIQKQKELFAIGIPLNSANALIEINYLILRTSETTIENTVNQ
jgi:hypothetical protein